MTGEPIDVYADYACPFCYLGHASLESFRENRSEPRAVEWHPFDLLADQRDESGEIVRESPRDDEYFEEAWQNVQRLADEYGVAVPDESITDTDSLRAQQLSLFVQENHPDEWEALDDSLYHAVWRAERDISDPTVLEDIVRDAGLDGGVVEEALSDDELRSRLRGRFEEARQRGITGVPTFVHEGRAARGAVPPAQLRRLVERTD